MSDNVNHPAHYKQQCSLECIEAMEIAFGQENVAMFCMCNAFKYLWRYKNKGGQEDLKKARWYVERYKGVNSIKWPEQIKAIDRILEEKEYA